MLSLWVLFSAAVALSVATTVDDCPASLINDGSLEVSNGFCFYFAMKEAREYKDAERSCEQHGGTLALVKTRKIHDFIYSNLKYKYGYNRGLVFIGLNDLKTEGNYMWEDGTSLGEWQNWAPDYGPEDSFIDTKFSFLRDCVAMDLSQEGRWIDYHCESWFLGKKNPFICQFNVTPKTTTPKPTTSKPTTPKPTTPKPTTPKPTTPKPTTSKPTTSKQTTPKPTTPKPTTSKQTTPKPTTVKPTTSESTTQKPTTPKPITAKRTSSKPTTQVLKTSKPTCPPFSCSVDCGMEGYKTDTNGCALCVCDV